MIIVDIEVPMLGKKYDFQIDEHVRLGDVKIEIIDMICRKEQYMVKGNMERLLIWNKETGMRLSEKYTAQEVGLVTGSCLLCI